MKKLFIVFAVVVLILLIYLLPLSSQAFRTKVLEKSPSWCSVYFGKYTECNLKQCNPDGSCTEALGLCGYSCDLFGMIFK